MTVDELYLENLSELIYDENKNVTYKFLAGMLDVHVNTAKQMLYTFYTREKAKGKELYATYFLSGFAPPNTFGKNDNELTKDDPMDDKGSGIRDQHYVILCGCNKLEKTKKKFTKLLSVHIYALSGSPIENYQDLKCSTERVRKVYKPSYVDEKSSQPVMKMEVEEEEEQEERQKPNNIIKNRVKVEDSPMKIDRKEPNEDKVSVKMEITDKNEDNVPVKMETTDHNGNNSPKKIQSTPMLGKPRTSPPSNDKKGKKRKLPASSSQSKTKQRSITCFFQKK